MKKSSLILYLVSYESSKQRIHMKNQALFSSKDKNKNLECCLLQFLCGALRVQFSPTVDFHVLFNTCYPSNTYVHIV